MDFSLTSTRLAAAVAPLAAALAFALPTPAAHADTTCTKVASTTGSDSAAGTPDAPFRTAQQLADSLAPGDTGCLHGGTYTEDLTITDGGESGAPITITSYPGERAKVVGRLWIARGADYVTVADLDLNGTTAHGTNSDTLPSPTVNASHTTFRGNDVTNDHDAICFVLGSDSYGKADDTVLDGNAIHDCGVMPAENHDHGIYIVQATGTEIVNNLIYDNADRGIQLYPSANRTHIAGNVIDGNGEGIIFSGDDGVASNDTTVEDNIITNSTIRNNVESYYPENNPIGHGNVVRGNCIGGGRRDNGDGAIGDETGYTVANDNKIVDSPKFTSRGPGGFVPQASSPCAGYANGATHSTATRVASQSSAVAPSTSPSQPAVSVKTTVSSSGTLRLTGRVSRGLALRAAAARPTRAVIQIRRSGHWHTLKSLRVKMGRFDIKVRVPAKLQGKVISLRVMVPKLGKSKTIRVRTSR